MKISSSFNNVNRNNSSHQSFKAIPKNTVYYPNALGKLGKVIGEYVNAPEQKLFLATTALMLQPLIDLKFVEEDKKVDTAIKSASKIIAGSFTGVLIRAAFLKMTSSLMRFDKHNWLTEHFMPDEAKEMKRLGSVLADKRLAQYANALGTLFAVIFMVGFSNAKIDVPLKDDIMDIISGVVKEDKSWLKSSAEVVNNRKNKIVNWFKAKGNVLVQLPKKLSNIKNYAVSESKKDYHSEKIDKGTSK